MLCKVVQVILVHAAMLPPSTGVEGGIHSYNMKLPWSVASNPLPVPAHPVYVLLRWVGIIREVEADIS